jgi:hypothetical protein
VLLDDTTFTLTLDEFLSGSGTFVFDVAEAPATVSVPAISGTFLVGTALSILAAAFVSMRAGSWSARTRAKS